MGLWFKTKILWRLWGVPVLIFSPELQSFKTLGEIVMQSYVSAHDRHINNKHAF